MKKFWLIVAIASFLTLLGFGVRYAEDSQVGYTNDTSMWIFIAAGLLVYYAALTWYVNRRDRRRDSERKDAK